MKKSHLMLIALVVLCATVVAVQANCGSCCDPCDPCCSAEGRLIAGGGNVKSQIDVGCIQVSTCDTDLTVTYVTTGSWCLLETHLHVFADNTEFTDVPHKNGNPIPGQFAYSGEHSDTCVKMVTYTIPADTLPYIAAHAVVKNSCTCQEETAWGRNACGTIYEFPGANWATYLQYEINNG
jgi:hypothetical protein